jgi:hypothetical protein
MSALPFSRGTRIVNEGDHPAPALPDFRLLVYLFVGMRLVLLLAHPPTLVESGGAIFDRGLTVYGDFLYHFGIAENSRAELLPYRDFWYEYPPLIPILSGVVYALSGANYNVYATLLALLLTVFDVGNLALVRRIGDALRGPAAGEVLAWLYALAVAPLVLVFWNFEVVVTFWILLALWWLIRDRHVPAAAAIALGALTKLVPLLILGTVWRFRPAPVALRVTFIAGGLTAVGLTGVLAIGPEYGWPSLSAQLTKASFQTVWALIDRNYITGVFDNARLDVAAASRLQGNPPVIPAWARTALFAGIGLALYATTRRRDNSGLIAFAALTVVVFYLWSAGWSTQWQALLIPLLLLTLPGRAGPLLALSLAVVSFAEYPLLFVRTVGADGALSPAGIPLLTITVLVRTAILVGYGAALWAHLRKAG